MSLIKAQFEEIARQALLEDAAWGDVTSEALIDPSIKSTAYILVKEKGVSAGVQIAEQVFLAADPALLTSILIADGEKVKPGDRLLKVQGRSASILKAERVALNFVQHLSGVATMTALFVKEIEGLPVRIADTRKTIPGLRILEKQAVIAGGATNHRMHLGDCILIKNNHIAILRKQGLSLTDIITRARNHNTFIPVPVEIEVRTIEEALEAARAKVEIIMLDNMTPAEMKKAVSRLKGKVIIEASGGVNLDNVRQIAETGVDIISVGALTHSAKALDLSLSME
jgi:nicotinate-nucleotide pyrophosphorylase (carboxylating)